MMTRAYGSGATLGIAALQYLGIVFSFFLGMVWFDEQLTWLSGAGIVLIVAAGVAATLLRERPRSTLAAPTES
jgi:S-adenosylmethionine uptake transporter